MSKKKSYMNIKNIFNEVIFDNLKKILTKYPKLKGNKKINDNIDDLNIHVDKLEDMINSELQDIDPRSKKIKIKKYSLKDFI